MKQTQKYDKTCVYFAFLHTPQNTVRKEKGFQGISIFVRANFSGCFAQHEVPNRLTIDSYFNIFKIDSLAFEEYLSNLKNQLKGYIIQCQRRDQGVKS